MKFTNNKRLVSAFVPYGVSGNPYQDNLSSALAGLGVEVQKGELKGIFRGMLLRRNWVNILHLHWLSPYTFAAPSLIRLVLFVSRLVFLRLTGVKIIWTAHNIIPHESMCPQLDLLAARIVVGLAQGIIAHGATARDILISAFKIRNTRKVHVIPHGHFIDNYTNVISRGDARAKLGIPSASKVILFLGLIRPYKGVLQLIDAFKDLYFAEDTTRLVIAGAAMNTELSQKIRSRIGDCKTILYRVGFVPNEDVQIYMNACDIFVLPYEKTLTSGAVILAMSFGRACVAPRMGCIGDVLDDEGAFFYETSKTEDLCNALRLACTNQERLEKMGRYNRIKVQEWDWTSIGVETKKVYVGEMS